MIDLNNLPTVGGVKIIPVEIVLGEIGCQDRPFGDELTGKLLKEWMQAHNFGFISWVDWQRPMWKEIVLKAAEEQFVDGIIFEDLS